ncbi:hypothetical protein Leryth_000588 [Lithospermum erythrorhizon]|nr:hypothetical protein Leryth_000588 [Lithospermum erythrorhizon]
MKEEEEEPKIKMERALPYVGMVIMQCAQVGLLVACKVAMSNGMSTFTFAFYSNTMSFLILVPVCYVTYRSSHPPLYPSFLYGFFLLGVIGFLVQILGYAGIQYASASLSAAILNLIPGFTFILAVILRIEKFEPRSIITQVKASGTLVSIAGALTATLYQGPALLRTSSSDSNVQILNQSATWIIGGSLLMIDCFAASGFIIAQAFVLKKCRVELILMVFYSCFVAILSAIVSLVTEKDVNSWSLTSLERLIPVIYAGFFGNIFQVTIIAWCVGKKGPLFVAMFHPLGVVITTAIGVIFLGDTFYLGSLIGSIIVVIGFYSVIWGKAKEWKMIKNDESLGTKSSETIQTAPLLQDTHNDPEFSA